MQDAHRVEGGEEGMSATGDGTYEDAGMVAPKLLEQRVLVCECCVRFARKSEHVSVDRVLSFINRILVGLGVSVRSFRHG